MHRPRTEGRSGGMGEVSWAEGGWRMDRGMEGREGEQGGPRAPPPRTGSQEEHAGHHFMGNRWGNSGNSVRLYQPGQPGKGTEAGRFSQTRAWGRRSQWGPSHSPLCPAPHCLPLFKLLPFENRNNR